MLKYRTAASLLIFGNSIQFIELVHSDGFCSEFFRFGLAGGPSPCFRVHRVLNLEKFLVRVSKLRNFCQSWMKKGTNFELNRVSTIAQIDHIYRY